MDGQGIESVNWPEIFAGPLSQPAELLSNSEVTCSTFADIRDRALDLPLRPRSREKEQANQRERRRTEARGGAPTAQVSPSHRPPSLFAPADLIPPRVRPPPCALTSPGRRQLEPPRARLPWPMEWQPLPPGLLLPLAPWPPFPSPRPNPTQKPT